MRGIWSTLKPQCKLPYSCANAAYSRSHMKEKQNTKNNSEKRTGKNSYTQELMNERLSSALLRPQYRPTRPLGWEVCPCPLPALPLCALHLLGYPPPQNPCSMSQLQWHVFSRCRLDDVWINNVSTNAHASSYITISLTNKGSIHKNLSKHKIESIQLYTLTKIS